MTASWGWHPAVVVARRSALPVQVLPMLVGGVRGADGTRRYDDAARARAELAGAMIAVGVPRGLVSVAIADAADRDVELVRGLCDQWRSLARGWHGVPVVAVTALRVAAVLVTVFLTGLLVGAWLW
jgi:hypothetical protein